MKLRYLKTNPFFNKKVFIESLGCSKNLVKSEKIASLFYDNDFQIINAIEDIHPNDLIIINTCGFIKDARLEAEETINKYKSYLKDGNNLFVVGCYASRFSTLLKNKFPKCTILKEVDVIKGLQNELNLQMNPSVNRLLSTKGYAYIEIATGCDKKCAYCLIPSIQGCYKSYPTKILLTEIRKILDINPIKEIILIAQDTSSYGRDLSPRENLKSLLESIASFNEIEWIRVLYLYPSLTIREIKEILTLEKVIPYLDIPLQHISPRILKLMNRPKSLDKYLDQLFTLKTQIQELTIRSTFIVGFPGETEEDFDILLQGLKKYKFDRAGFFSYSKEKETEAFSYNEQVPSSVKRKRLKEAYGIQENISLLENRKFIGKVIPVLLESYDPAIKKATGRTYREAPDVDPRVFITGNPIFMKNRIGSIQKMKITNSTAYEISGTLII